VAGAIALALLGDQMLYVVLPGQPELAGIGVGALGLVLSANRFVRLGVNALGGRLSDRVGRRPMFLLGMALALVSTLGYLVTTTLAPLLAARVVWGVAFALISVGGVSIAMDLSTPGDRGRTLGGYQAAVQGGTLLGLVLSGVLVDVIGYRGTLALYVPLTALGLVIALLTVPETAPARRATPDHASDERGRSETGLRALDPWLLVPAYVEFASFFVSSGVIMSTLGLMLRQVEGATPNSFFVPVATLTGIMLASRRLVGMMTAPVAGWVSDRTGDRRRVALVGAGIVLAGFGVLLLDGGRTFLPVAGGVILTAIGESVLQPSLAAWVGDSTPPGQRGVMMGGLATAKDLGAAVAPSSRMRSPPREVWARRTGSASP
jgi:MFS family permease